MFYNLILPSLTAVGSTAITWYLARTHVELGKLRTALKRQKQRNRSLITQLELANAKLQFQATLRTVEVSTLKACLPHQHLYPQLEGSLQTISESLDSAFREGQGILTVQKSSAKDRKGFSAKTSIYHLA